MVHLRDLAFVIIYSLILYNVKLSISFPTQSTLSYKEIEREIRDKVSNVNPVEREEKLVEIAAQEKYDHQRTKEERDKFETKADENLKKAESAEKDRKNIEKIHVRIKPRELIYSVKEKFQLEYVETMETIRANISSLEADFKNCPRSITHFENQLQNTKLTDEERFPIKANLISRNNTCNELPSRIKALQDEVPNPVWTLVNVRHHRILKKTHNWKWIIRNKQNDPDVKKIMKYLGKFYNEKTDVHKKEMTFEKYVDSFCESMADVEEDVSNEEVHLLQHFPVKEDHEFKIIRIFGRKNLDEYTTILINALGLYYFVEGEDETDFYVPGSVTRKVQL